MSFQDVADLSDRLSECRFPSRSRDLVLITGAAGFIGRQVSIRLDKVGYRVRRMIRPSASNLAIGDARHEFVWADLLDEESLSKACEGVAMVVHCAGYAHTFGDAKDEAQRLNQLINFEGTRNLARIAGQCGVARLVFLSSVKAMGSPGDHCVGEDWSLLPETLYGRAKLDAELAVLDAGAHAGMQVTNLRLAMVYGPGSRGNLERMLRGVRAGWFPPLPNTGKPRSLVHVHDVASAVETVLADERANGRTYIVAHPDPVTAADLYDAMRKVVGKAPARWRVPAGLMRFSGRVGDGLGRLIGYPTPFDSAVVSRLLDGACYCPDVIRNDLGWVARVDLVAGLETLINEQLKASLDGFDRA